MTLDILDKKVQQMIDNQIQYIRRMSLLSDDQIRQVLYQRIIEHPHLLDNYEQEEQKKMLYDIKKAATNIKSNPSKISRKVA